VALRAAEQRGGLARDDSPTVGFDVERLDEDRRDLGRDG
jgi:hypothetical protein